VRIGFENVKEVVDHYYRKETEKYNWKSAFEVRTESAPGIELAFVVSKPDFGNVWDFEKTSDYRRRANVYDAEEIFIIPPGMCIEGIRVRSRIHPSTREMRRVDLLRRIVASLWPSP
jgi:hypothetical protein